MFRNPLSRKPRSPLDQTLDVINDLRAEAADIAATVRDAAAKTADALGDAAPSVRGSRLPILGVAIVVGLGAAIVMRSKLKGGGAPVGAYPTPSAAQTAAQTTASAPVSPSVKSKPAAKVEPEQPKEPQAETAESEPASG